MAKNYVVGGIEYDWKTGAPAKNDAGYLTRANQIAIQKDKSKDMGGGVGLDASYKKEEEKAFEEAEEWQKSDEKAEILKKFHKGQRPGHHNEKLPPNLRYPYSTIDDTQDFIQFRIFNYERSGMKTEGDSLLTGFKEGNVFQQEDREKKLNALSLGSIILPFPAQLSDSNTAAWQSGNMNFLQAGGLEIADAVAGGEGEKAGNEANKIIGQASGSSIVKEFFKKQALNSLGGNLSMESVLARGSGQILNPNMELLFNGPSLRQFSFAFKFTPRFQKEAEAVRTIMKAFKRNMAPKGAGGAMLKTPNIFEIRYIGKAKNYLNRIKMCALQNVGINYTGDGTFATYKDGAPISSSMTLQFQELTPVYNEDYAGYDDNTDGVGY